MTQYKYPPLDSALQVTAWSDPDIGGAPPLHILVKELQTSGVKVTRGNEYLALMAVMVPHEPATTKDLLAQTPKQFLDSAIVVGTYAATRDAISSTLTARKIRAEEMLRESMRKEVNDYLDALRPEFDDAADAARALVQKGVRPMHTADDLLELDPEVAAEWSAFKRSHHIGVLIKTMNLRAGLARALNLEFGMASDFAEGITHPPMPGLIERYRHHPLTGQHVMWLEAAPALNLNPFIVD